MPSDDSEQHTERRLGGYSSFIRIPICLHSLLSLGPPAKFLQAHAPGFEGYFGPDCGVPCEFLASVPEADTIQDTWESQMSQDPQQMLKGRLRHAMEAQAQMEACPVKNMSETNKSSPRARLGQTSHTGDYAGNIRRRRQKNQVQVLILPLTRWVTIRKSLTSLNLFYFISTFYPICLAQKVILKFQSEGTLQISKYHTLVRYFFPFLWQSQ